MDNKNRLVAALAIILLLLIAFFLRERNMEPITLLHQKYLALEERYAQQPSPELAQEIDAVEQAVVAEIAQNGLQATVKTNQKEPLEVLDTTNVYQVIATLVNGEVIKIYERHYNGMFVIATTDGIRGYLLHDNFSPSIHSFPLKILVEQTTAPASPSIQPIKHPLPKANNLIEQEEPPSLVSTQERGGNYSQSHEPQKPMDDNCPSVQCTAITQRGTRCKRPTTNCNERCFQH